MSPPADGREATDLFGPQPIRELGSAAEVNYRLVTGALCISDILKETAKC